MGQACLFCTTLSNSYIEAPLEYMLHKVILQKYDKFGKSCSWWGNPQSSHNMKQFLEFSLTFIHKFSHFLLWRAVVGIETTPPLKLEPKSIDFEPILTPAAPHTTWPHYLCFWGVIFLTCSILKWKGKKINLMSIAPLCSPLLVVGLISTFLDLNYIHHLSALGIYANSCEFAKWRTMLATAPSR